MQERTILFIARWVTAFGLFVLVWVLINTEAAMVPTDQPQQNGEGVRTSIAGQVDTVSRSDTTTMLTVSHRCAGDFLMFDDAHTHINEGDQIEAVIVNEKLGDDIVPVVHRLEVVE